MTNIIEGINTLARTGPLPALHALSRPRLCEKCGFRWQCHTPENCLTPFVPKTFA